MSKPPAPDTLEGVLALLRHPGRTAITKRADSADAQAENAVPDANRGVSTHADAVLTPTDTTPAAVGDRQHAVSTHADGLNTVSHAKSVLPSALSVQSGREVESQDTRLEPPPLPPAVVELLLRHYAGDFDPRVRTRLDQIFASNPPDAIERLARAATFLGITGAGLAEAEERAMARHREVN